MCTTWNKFMGEAQIHRTYWVPEWTINCTGNIVFQIINYWVTKNESEIWDNGIFCAQQDFYNIPFVLDFGQFSVFDWHDCWRCWFYPKLRYPPPHVSRCGRVPWGVFHWYWFLIMIENRNTRIWILLQYETKHLIEMGSRKFSLFKEEHKWYCMFLLPLNLEVAMRSLHCNSMTDCSVINAVWRCLANSIVQLLTYSQWRSFRKLFIS